jgi:chromosome segregation ATPase
MGGSIQTTQTMSYLAELNAKHLHPNEEFAEACAEVDRLRNDLADLQQDFRKIASDKGDIERELAKVSSAQKIQKQLLDRSRLGADQTSAHLTASEARAAELERRLGECVEGLEYYAKGGSFDTGSYARIILDRPGMRDAARSQQPGRAKP